MAVFLLLVMASAVMLGSASSPFEETLENRIVKELSDPNYRLNNNIIPESYKLTLTPNLVNFTFSGEVDITFRVVAVTREIKMHSKFLTISEAKIGTNNVAYTFESPYDFVKFTTTADMGANTIHTLSIKFTGTLKDDMLGFYRSYYVENGKLEWLAATQFQQVHAREAFPCLDEPGFKAKFNIIIECPANYTCHSNMPRKATPTGQRYEFYETPEMSTYLVAFIVTKYEVASSTPDGHPTPSKILARPDAKAMGNYSQMIGDSLVEYMDIYFNKTYSTMGTNMKLDHVAIPDFYAGAMENWGLVTYKEAFLMYQPGEMTVPFKQRIAHILSHEIAHQWFGNYMTCDWWSNTWLNEGYARFFQHYATEEVEKFGLPDQFITSQVHASMLVDTPKSSNPMSNPNTNSPADITSQFGTITYSKGATIIRMMENVMGKENFQKGHQNLLSDRSFKTVTPIQLFTELEKAWTKPEGVTETIQSIMSTWTERAGFPLLSVSVARPSGVITLNQKRFGRENVNDATLYNIPLTYRTEAQTDNTPVVRAYMKTANHTITIPNLTGYVLFNLQQIGFYRVNYDDVTWNALISALSTDRRNIIHEYNRAQIVDDAFNLARENVINYTRMFDITKYLEHELKYTPWTAAIAGFSFMRIHFGKNATLSPKLDSYILKSMAHVISNLGLDDKSSSDNLEKTFRANILTFACSLGHSACISSSRTHFNQLRTGTRVPADLREHVYCNALRHGTRADFDFLLNKHNNENVVGEQLLILGVLGCTKDALSLNRYLGMTLDPYSGLRDQDKMTAFNSALNGNPENVQVVSIYVRENIGRVKQSYGSSRLMTIFNNILTRSNATQINEFEAFLNTSLALTADEKASGLNLVQNIRETIVWANSKSDEIVTWLNKNGSGSLVASFTLMLSMLIALFYKY